MSFQDKLVLKTYTFFYFFSNNCHFINWFGVSVICYSRDIAGTQQKKSGYIYIYNIYIY